MRRKVWEAQTVIRLESGLSDTKQFYSRGNTNGEFSNKYSARIVP